jgi:hypothetical protein
MVDGRGVGHGSEALRELIALASAPSPGQSDQAQLGMFLAAFREAADAPGTASATGTTEAAGTAGNANVAPRPGNPSPARRRVVSRSLAVQSATVALIVCAGAVAAADANILPDAVQRVAHQYLGGVGVPAPSDSSARPSASATPGTAAGTPRSSGSPSPSPSATSSPPSAALVAALCGEVNRDPKNWQSNLGSADRDSLSVAAGGEQKVKQYCAHLPGGAVGDPTPSVTPPMSSPPSATPTQPHGNPHPSHTPPHPHTVGG